MRQDKGQRRLFRLGIASVVLFGLWAFSGRILMEFDWQQITDESTVPIALRADLAEGRTGPQMKPDPCMMHQTELDLDLRLDGAFPVGLGRDLVMEVVIFSDSLMVDRVYLGPPTRQLALDRLPLCLSDARGPLQATDPAAQARISVVFYDLDGRRFSNFSGEEAFPVLAWGAVRVDWRVMAWEMEGSGSLTRVMVTPL